MPKNLLRLLKHRAYMCYWFATAFSMGASNILQFVLSLYVLKMTGSPTVFASMLSVIVVPRLILTPVGGVLGDRFSKVRALRVLNVVNILLLSGYALGIAVYGDLSLTAVFALVVALEVVEIFYQGPEAALLPEIIENDLLEEATTLSKIDNGIIWISGPMIGSFLYRQFGVHAGIIASAVCIGIAFVLNFGIKTPFAATRAPKSGERQTFRRSFVEGLQIIRRDSLLMGLIPITNLVTMSFGAVFSVVVTYLMLEVYQVSAYTYGLYRSVTASMGIWMPMLALPIVKKVKFKNLLGGASLIIAASLFFIGLSAYFAEGGTSQAHLRSVIIITILDCVTIASVIPLHIAVSVFNQRRIPVEARSRVFSIFRMISIIAGAAGNMLYGFLAEHLRPFACIWIAAVAVGMVYPLIVYVFRSEGKYDVNPGAHP